jgi:hypothetical protein
MKFTTQRNLLLHTLLTLFIVYSSSALAVGVWEVTYTGQSQGVNFSRQGNISIAWEPFASQTSNQPNPIELAFYSGNPLSSPESGAIWFMTNNHFLSSENNTDLADISTVPTVDNSGQCIVVVPDPNTTGSVEGAANIFNASSGVTADVYKIFSGTMSICSADGWNTINGEIHMLGIGTVSQSNAEYHATISGQYIGEQ